MFAKIQNRFRSLVLEIIVLAILIPVSIFLFTKLSGKPQEEITASSSPSPTTASVDVSATPAILSAITSSEPTAQAIKQSITLTITSPDKSSTYKIQTEKSLSVVTLLQSAQQQGLQLKTKDYGAPLGILIEEINNIKNDQKNQRYWTLYINDKMSVLGASSTIVSPGESVTWKFENTTL